MLLLLYFILAILPFIAPLILGFLLDRWLGDPMRFGHPIVFFGWLIRLGEKALNRSSARRLKGFLYNGVLVFFTFTFTFLFTFYLSFLFLLAWLDIGIRNTPDLVGISIIVGYVVSAALIIFYMLSGKTLVKEVKDVFSALNVSLEAGRKQVGRIVGRDTETLSVHEVRTAALETLAENLSDGVVAPMLSWSILDIPGIVTYKMINTQDSMVGYLNERYRAYGYFSAKLDDLVNLLPSRITAILMLLSAGRLDLLFKTFRHGKRHLSPNSGYPEAAMALILGCRFGGPHDYFGEVVDKPYIGEVERELSDADLQKAVHIAQRTEGLALGLSLLLRLLLIAALLVLLIHP